MKSNEEVINQALNEVVTLCITLSVHLGNDRKELQTVQLQCKRKDMQQLLQKIGDLACEFAAE